jgi:hypothetical protein
MKLINWFSAFLTCLYNICKLSKYRVNTMIQAVSKIDFTKPKWHTEIKLIPMGGELLNVFWYTGGVQCELL